MAVIEVIWRKRVFFYFFFHFSLIVLNYFTFRSHKGRLTWDDQRDDKEQRQAPLFSNANNLFSYAQNPFTPATSLITYF